MLLGDLESKSCERAILCVGHYRAEQIIWNPHELRFQAMSETVFKHLEIDPILFWEYLHSLGTVVRKGQGTSRVSVPIGQ